MSQPQYNHLVVEKKWQDYWQKQEVFYVRVKAVKKKKYILVEFPYPSGAGLHMGHLRPYVAGDVVSRYFRMRGFQVMYPIGWDAFGLPAENFAIKNKVHPSVSTEANVANAKAQMNSWGLSFDWSREVNTTHPDYYKWTQWIFLQLYKKGLAYEATGLINWCPKDKTGLANEEVIDGKCERCGALVEKKELRQWYLKITAYAEKLLKGLAELKEWPEQVKVQQANWIGESQGALVKFPLINVAGQADKKHVVEVFTTRLDTIFGATFIVISPELAQKWVEVGWQVSSDVKKYIELSLKGKELDRVAKSAKEKTGVDTGVKAINPATNEAIPVWIADYVLGSYGTGAIMAVPAHDERDNEFAKKFNLPIKQVIEPLFIKSVGKDAVRGQEPLVKREAVACVIKHWSEDKYLILKWRNTDWAGFVTGGLDGEDPVTAGQREIIEETGYKNMKFIKELGQIVNVQFYHLNKKENRHARFRGLYFELVDGQRAPISEAEKKICDLQWINRDEVETTLSVPDMKFIWRRVFDDQAIYQGDGLLSNSGKFSGLTNQEAIPKIAKKLGAELKTQYRLRDWLFSRQRYWGEPIPIIHCSKCGPVPVPETDLPVELPPVKNYEPTGTGESPLAAIADWVNISCPKCHGQAKRETNTMPQWAGSSWYWLRYTDSHNKKTIADKSKLKNWTPVDIYFGGYEHTTLHLLYSRFWNLFLYDQKIVTAQEPFIKRVPHGIVLGPDGEKMSKSRGNVVDPQTLVDKYGADALRLHMLFIGPHGDQVAWNDKGMVGVKRFLEKVWRLASMVDTSATTTAGRLDKIIKKVTLAIESFQFNTAVAALMEAGNELAVSSISLPEFKTFLILLYPMAPHLTSELWPRLNLKNNIWDEVWPTWDEKNIIEDTVSIVVQINGVKRAVVNCAVGSSEKIVHNLALADSKIAERVAGQQVKRVIFVKDKLINLVVS